MIDYSILLLKIWSVVILNLFNHMKHIYKINILTLKFHYCMLKIVTLFVATISVIIYIGDIAVCQNK